LIKYDKKLKDIKLKDLFFVILYGGIISILLVYVLGFLDFYISKTISFSFMMILFFFSAQFVGGLVRKQYINPHLLYTILTGIFLVLQVIIILGVKFALLAFPENIMVIFDINLYFYYVYLFFVSIFTNFSFDLLLMLLVIVVGIYVGIKKTY